MLWLLLDLDAVFRLFLLFGRLIVGGCRCCLFFPIFGPLQRGAMSGDQMLPQIPLVLYNLMADIARHALALDMHVDGVLFQVERIAKRLETVGANSWLHATPSISRMRGRTTTSFRRPFTLLLQLLLAILTLRLLLDAFLT